MDVECRQHDRRDGVTRNGKGEHGNEGSADAGVVGRLAGDDPLHSTFPEGPGGILHRLPGLVVGDDGGHGSSRPGKGADEGPDDRRPERQGQVPDHLPEGIPHPARFFGNGAHGPPRHLVEHLGETEQADQGGNEGNASLQVGQAEGIAGRA